MLPSEVYVQYRKNLDDFNQWEEQKREDHAAAIRQFKKRERETAPRRFKPPLWLVGVSAILAVCIVGWLITILVFSQKDLYPH